MADSSLERFLNDKGVKVPKKVTSEETKLKDAAIRFLESLRKEGHAIVWNKRWSGGIFQKAGFPDLEIWYKAKHIDVEFKDMSDTSTLQDDKIKDIEATGNIVVVIDNLRAFKDLIRSI